MKPGAASTNTSNPTTGDTVKTVEERERLLDEILREWQAGVTPNAQKALEENPCLVQSRSAVIELACEEFWRRTNGGESLTADSFCDRFPGYATALRRVLSLGSQINLFVEGRNSDWPAIGTVYRGFLLKDRLGCGAFSRVYLAADTTLADREVALKITTLPGNEPVALGRLQHENVVPVLAHFPADEDGFTTLVMPYLGRTTLEEVLDRVRADSGVPKTVAPISDLLADGHARQSYEEFVLRIACGLSFGLAEAHRHGFLHLDVKPSNVLLATDGHAKLLDFNLTRVADQTEGLVTGGTLPYMSPEQIDAAALNGPGSMTLDGRSDVFSLGVVLFELLSGRHPFGELDPAASIKDSSQQLRERHRNGPRSLSTLNPLVGKECRRLIESCLAHDVTQRPANALELAMAFRRELGWRSRLVRTVRRHPNVFRALGMLTVMLVAAAAYGWTQLPTYADRCEARAMAAIDGNRFSDAIDAATNGLADEPNRHRSRLLRAHALTHQRQWDPAIADYLALADTQFASNSRSGLIYCYANKNLFTLALQTGAVVAASPDATPFDLNNLAYCWQQKGKHEAARPLLDRAAVNAPTDVSICYNRALCDLQHAFKTKGYRPVTGLNDLLTAVQQRQSGDLYYFLAAHYMVIGGDGAQASAETALTEAMRYGYARAELLKTSWFAKLNLPDQPQPIPDKTSATPRLIFPPLNRGN